MKRRVAVLVMLLAGILSCSQQRKSASICEIFDAPGNFNGSELSVRGYIDSDGFEWLQLRDDRCPQFGMNVDFSEEFADRPLAKQIREAVFYTLPPGTDFKDIRGTFSGRFRWSPEAPDAHRKRFQFVVDGVSGLTVRTLREKRPSPYPGL
jgi:hypothetical protein